LVELSNRDKHTSAVEVIPTYRCWVDERSTMQTRSVIRRSGGFAVEEARLELMIAPAMTDTPERQPNLPLGPAR